MFQMGKSIITSSHRKIRGQGTLQRRFDVLLFVSINFLVQYTQLSLLSQIGRLDYLLSQLNMVIAEPSQGR